jgi:S-methylmethionine-dependent homocysteine/selenocysteine methylase
MSNLTEAEAAVTAAKSTTLPIWIAFKLDDDRAGGYLPDGTPLLDVIAFAMDLKVDAVLLNCSKPEVIDRNVPTLQTFAGQTGVYPNGFESINALDVGGTVSSLKRREDFTIESFTRFMKNAHRQGVSILGGCCETTPEYIRALSQLSFNRLSLPQTRYLFL